MVDVNKKILLGMRGVKSKLTNHALSEKMFFYVIDNFMFIQQQKMMIDIDLMNQ
jgi:hypothetical protein